MKVLELCGSKSNLQNHIMPKKSSTDQDITQASVAQLAKLMAEKLRCYNWHLATLPKQQWLNGCIMQSMLQHNVDSSASQSQQDTTYKLTLCQQSDEPVPSQQRGTLQQDMQQQQQLRHTIARHAASAAKHAAKHAAALQNQSCCYFTAATAHQRHAHNCTYCLHRIGKVV